MFDFKKQFVEGGTCRTQLCYAHSVMKRGQIAVALKKRDRELGHVVERRSSLLESLVERARKAAVATNVSFPDIFSSPPPSSLEDVLRELGGKNSASASLFMAVMSNNERDELTFSKGDKRHQLIEKLVRRKFEAFADCVELYCGKDLVPGEEILERILETVRGRSESQSSSSSVAADEEEEVSGDKEATPEKPPKEKNEMRVVASKKKRRETRERVVGNEAPKQPVKKEAEARRGEGGGGGECERVCAA